MLLTRSFYNPALLRSDLRRSWPLLGGYTLLWLLIFPLRLLRGLADSAPEFDKTLIQSILLSTNYATAWINLFAGLILAMSLFSYLASPRATYGLHSLPVSRGCQFRTHVLCAVGGVVCSNVLTLVLTILSQCGHGVEWGASFSWLVYSLVTFLLFFAIGVLCCMLCGWLPAAVVAFVGVNSLVLLGHLLVNVLCDTYYSSYSNGLFDFGVNSPVAWLTPILRLQMSQDFVALYGRASEVTLMTTDAWNSLLVYGIAAVVLLVGSFALYRLRRSERSGDTLAFKPLQPIVRWIVGLMGGLGLGLIFAALVGSTQEFELLLGCSLVLGAVCMAGCQMLIAKTPKVFKKLWPELLALCLVIAALCGCMERDLFGYESKVPDADQVQSVVVNLHNGTNCVLSDPEEIDAVLQAHTYLQQRSDDHGEDYVSRPITLTYSLKDGSTLSRRFYTSTGAGSEDRTGILPILETETFRRSFVLDTTDGLRVEDLRTGYWDLVGRQMELTQEQSQALYTAALEDIDAMDMATVGLYDAEECILSLRLQSLDGNAYAYVNLNRQCTRVLQLLQDWGIVENTAILFTDTYDEDAGVTYDAALLQ